MTPSFSVLTLFGPPFAGKDTLTLKLLQHFAQQGVSHAVISTGAFARGEVVPDGLSPTIRDQMHKFQADGHLVPDDTMMAVVSTAIQELQRQGMPKILALNGAIRKYAQFVTLHTTFNVLNYAKFVVLDLNISASAAALRAEDRVQCSNKATCGHYFSTRLHKVKLGDKCPDCKTGKLAKRPDDNAATVLARFDAYAKSTQPTLDKIRKFTRASGLELKVPVLTVPAEASPDTVFNVSLELLKSYGI